ncbi:MAG: ATP-binding protein, partial [Methylovirgula sp.]
EGTGLGLAIVAKILEDHGGGLELLDSTEGRGACVRLYFPQGDDTQRAAESSQEELAAGEGAE